MDKGCVEIRIKGIVQGVGFRPFVYRLAKKLGVRGHVANTEQGVEILACAPESVLNKFIKALKGQAPPLSLIKSIDFKSINCQQNFKDFCIVKTQKSGKVSTYICPDVATCKECLKEIIDSSDRRFCYPFTNCTNCGPRYTIIKSLPYDRPYTSMNSFVMCQKCQAEYQEPLNRRFHAQPNACPECGPRLLFTDNTGKQIHGDPLVLAVSFLKSGKIVAIKGLGGFHLACDAFSDEAVSLLRKRKDRPFKPFAIMVRDIEIAQKLGRLDMALEELLLSFQAPIVIIPMRCGSGLSKSVAPRITDIGMMLPYTPLHHLLFRVDECPKALVMTSGNPKDEPLCTNNDEAIERLGSFVDGFLAHNRDIFTGVDDSVLRRYQKGHFFIRRSRGYAPSPLDFPHKATGILGAGGLLKNTFCLTKDGSAYISQHIGNLITGPTFDFYKRNIAHLAHLLELEIRACGCDLHPDYLTTRYCVDSTLPMVKVQHHFAHAASVMAEHNLQGPCIAICLDGTGLGTDKTIWGGEILLCNEKTFKRLGRLKPFPLPGGDSCAKEPWRCGLSLLLTAFGEDYILPEPLREIASDKLLFVKQMILKKINVPLTSSLGRLFDAVSALTGTCLENSYEAQAAMELEAKCSPLLEKGNSSISNSEQFRFFFKHPNLLQHHNDILELDWKSFLTEALFSTDVRSIDEIALLFHAFVVAGFSKMAQLFCLEHGIDSVLLSGGCMQNRILLEGFIDFLEGRGIKCYTNNLVPANDGGLCLGQAFVAANVLGERLTGL